MPTEQIELLDLLPWRVEDVVETRYGKRVLRTSPTTSEFGELFRLNQPEMVKLGFSVKGGLVHWWASIDDAPVDQFVLSETLDNSDPLYEYQVPHARTLKQALKAHNVAFDGSDTGTGKTICNLVAQVRELGLTPLIICKKSGIRVWAQWCEDLNLRYLDIMNYDRVRLGQCEFVKQKRTGKTIQRARAMVADDYFLKWLSDGVGVPLKSSDLPAVFGDKTPSIDDPRFIEWFEKEKQAVLDKPLPKDMDFEFALPPRSIVIMDEVHKAANHGTVNSKILIAAKKSGYPLAMLSATAAETPLKMDALGFALGLHKSTDFRHWCAANGCTFDRDTHDWYFTGGEPALAKIQSNIFPWRGSRMRKRDIPGFPPVQITAEPVELGAEIRKLLRAYDGTDPHLAELAEKHNMADIAVVQRLYILQIAETCKIPFMLDETRDLLQEGFSVVLAVNFNETRVRLMRELKTECAVFGDQKVQDRDRHIANFQANKSRVIVINIQAGSDSISLNDTDGKYPRVGLVRPTDSAINLKQLFGRLNRATDKSMAQYRLIFAAGTPEEQVCRNVQSKINNIALLNDGDLRSEMQFFNSRK